MLGAGQDIPLLYPLFLNLRDKRVLVVGAGAVAHHKVLALVEAGAQVLVVAPQAVASLASLAQAGRIRWEARQFTETDVSGAWLVVAATSDSDVQRRAATAATANRIFVVAVDDPPRSSAYAGAIVSRPPMMVAISSSGAAPALSRLIRELIEELLPSDDWIVHARRLRADWRRDRVPMGERFGRLVKEIMSRRQ
jgi:uroporphyrin-III C-methyltransferase/precorrin-2 dehydrogenase/sirohydrochlorin ferrochelatase